MKKEEDKLKEEITEGLKNMKKSILVEMENMNKEMADSYLKRENDNGPINPKPSVPLNLEIEEPLLGDEGEKDALNLDEIEKQPSADDQVFYALIVAQELQKSLDPVTKKAIIEELNGAVKLKIFKSALRKSTEVIPGYVFVKLKCDSTSTQSPSPTPSLNPLEIEESFSSPTHPLSILKRLKQSPGRMTTDLEHPVPLNSVIEEPLLGDEGEKDPLNLNEIEKPLSMNELDLLGALSSGAIYGKDIALAINGFVFVLCIALPPRKRSKKSNPSFTNRRTADSPFFSQRTSNDITVDVPSTGPWKAITQGKPDQISLPTMEESMDTLHTRPCGLSYPLLHSRNAVTTHRASLPMRYEGLDAHRHHMVPTTVPTMLKHHQEVRPQVRVCSEQPPGSNTEDPAISGDPRAKSKRQQVQPSKTTPAKVQTRRTQPS
ncbi:hypothetical protein ACLOJK_008566 [Asimina triloba]